MRSKIYRVCVWEGTRYKGSKCEQEEKRETKDIGEVIRVRYDKGVRRYWKEERLGNIYVRDYMIHMTIAYTYQKKEMFVFHTLRTVARVYIFIYMHRVLRASDMEAQSCGSVARG